MRALILGVLLCLLVAAPAPAATRGQIIRDCADDGQLQGSYTRAELRDARHNLTSAVAEYTDCPEILRRAELPDRGRPSGDGAAPSAPGGGGGAGGGAPVAPSTEADHETLARAAAAGGEPVDVGARTILPGTAGLGTGVVRNDLPVPLIIALASLALVGLAPAARSLPWLGR